MVKTIPTLIRISSTQRIKIRHIEIFRAVVITSSVRGASEQLHVSPPAVSASLKQLEAIVGFALFTRTSNGLIPTSEGIAFNKRVAALYDNLDEISEFAVQLRQGVDASLRIACSPNLALDIIPSVIKRVLEKFPSSSFSIEVLPAKELVSAVVAQRADVAVGINLPHSPFGKAVTVGHCAVLAAIPSHWPEAQELQLTAANLATRPWVRFHPETTQGAATQAWLSNQTGALHSVASVRVARVACSLVEQGIGFALLDEFTSRRAATGSVACVAISPPLSYTVDFLKATAPTSTRLSDAFFSELKKLFLK